MTLRFQNFNNDLQGAGYNIEVYSSIFESQISCPIFVEQQVDLSVINCFFTSCTSTRKMSIASSRIPSTIAFSGKKFIFQYISIFNCSSGKIGLAVSYSDINQTYDHISCVLAHRSGLNPNFGYCSLTHINITDYVPSRGSGAIFIANGPEEYNVSEVNFINNSLAQIYAISSNRTEEQLTKNVNFIKNLGLQSLIGIWGKNHLFQNICIFENTFDKLLDIRATTNYRFVNSQADNETLTSSFQITDFSMNMISNFTIKFSAVPFQCTANANHLPFLIRGYFINVMIVIFI